MKRWIYAAITFFFFFCLHNQAYANQRGVNGLIIGGGAGAIMGQTIGRNVESTILGATVGGILGAVIASEYSHSHQRTVIIKERPRRPHGRHVNYGPRHHQPKVVIIQPYNHGKKHFHKGRGHKKNNYRRSNVHYENRNRHNPRNHRPHQRNDRYR